MIRSKAIFVALLCFLISCQNQVSTNPSADQIENTFQALLQEALDASFGANPGVSMSIISPKLNSNWAGVQGFDSIAEDNELHIDQPFRIASITKIFVAVAILRLHEMGQLSVDDPISQHILPSSKKILLGDKYDPEKIKIRHCLNHTSGLYDYAMGDRTYGDKILANPDKRWTRQEQLEAAMAWGEKIGEPGDQYDYCDTGYILLGEIIEKFFDNDLANGLRSLLKFESLNLDRTWLESLEAPPSQMPDPVHCYFSRNDATNFDASIDLYGGGGLMSTCPNLTTFFHALFNHQIFDKRETLELMLTKNEFPESYNAEEEEGFKDYRYGVWEIDIYGEKAYMHGGLWGTLLLHIPKSNSTFAVNSTKGRDERLLKKAILTIKNLKE